MEKTIERSPHRAKVFQGRGHHWAFRIAEALRGRGGTQEPLRIQSSISPSGVIHIGNFRDTLIAWGVAKALKLQGAAVELILNFDDADELKSKLYPAEVQKKPLSEVEKDGKSLAQWASTTYLQELKALGIVPDRILYQSEGYFREKQYRRHIHQVLKGRKKIRGILNEDRANPLPEDWTPLLIFCEGCQKKVEHFKVAGRLSWRGRRWWITYGCPHCGYQYHGDLDSLSYVKLSWRVDWPMRCHHEKIHFEPCGIDHYVQGSTITTSEKILGEVFRCAMPLVTPYEIVRFNQSKRKISSSKGDAFNLSVYLNLYPREIILWQFLSKGLMSPIVLNPQNDFFRYYAEYQRDLRAYQQGTGDQRLVEIFKLLGVDPEQTLVSVNMRKLCFLAQGYQYQVAPMVVHFQGENPQVPKEKLAEAIQRRLPYVKDWLTHYAPQAWRFQLTYPSPVTLQQVKQARELLAWLEQPQGKLIIKDYPTFYTMLFGKGYGPRVQRILTDWDRGKLKAHCQGVIALYEAQKGGEECS